jgi:hypothetical protein
MFPEWKITPNFFAGIGSAFSMLDFLTLRETPTAAK